ncbi:tetratricopeptide repeat protein [Kitasatospora sp. NPDC093806]|uniref:tetratricopeptide repeat protein n=1 Tax=Kitasatospora sp. NPDC093806 TaxID=3155075 RepID=UPI00342F04EC
MDTSEFPEPHLTGGATVTAERGGSAYVLTHGDIHVRDGVPVYRVGPAATPAPPLSPEDAGRRPSRLLLAEQQTVDFTGRVDELRALEAWRDEDDPGVSVLLLHAPGGQGKTRLAGEFAARAAARGWTCWEARHLSDPGLPDVLALGDPGRRLLLTVDYAERWPLDDLLLLLGNRLLHRPERTRILLVSRPAATWWPLLGGRLAADGLRTAPPVRLGPIATTEAGRQEVYRAACRAFARGLGTPAAVSDDPVDLTDDAYRLVLNLHMAALVSVHSGGRHQPGDPVALSAYLLDREHDFWVSLAEHGAVTTGPRTMARTVHTATLVRALPVAGAEQALARAGVAGAGATPATDVIVSDHAFAYPPLAADAGLVLAPLYPDRLGEDLIALRTPGHDHPDHAPDDWSHQVPIRLLSEDGPGPEPDPPSAPRPQPYAGAVLTTLIETARRWSHVAALELDPLLAQRPALALTLTGNALANLAQIDAVGIDTLSAVEATLPTQRHLALDAGIAVLAERLTAHRLSSATDPLDRACLHHDLAVRLARAGRHEEAVAEQVHAERLLRPLVAAGTAGAEERVPDDTDPHRQLALVLGNMGMQLDRLGRTEDGLAAVGEAVELWARLAAGGAGDAAPAGAGAGEYVGESAGALQNLSVLLTRLGRLPEAIEAAERAVRSRRAQATAAATGPGDTPDDHHLALLIGALGHRCAVLSTAGRHRDALADSGEVVRVYGELAAAHPDTYTHHLAAAVANHSGLLRRWGRAEEAAAAAAEAVRLFRGLARVNPAEFEPRLAHALNLLGARLSHTAPAAASLAASEEAVALLTRLAEANPAAYEASLADALHNLNGRLQRAGRFEEAVTAGRAAERIHRRLAAANPGAHGSDLSATLSSLCDALIRLGRHPEALAATYDALAVDRRLAGENPQAFQGNLAASFGRLAHLLHLAGRDEEAAAANTEAISVRRRLAEADLEAEGGVLALSLLNLSVDLRKLGRHQEALHATEEAVTLHRTLHRDHGAPYRGPLATGLAVHGRALSEAGLHDRALAVTEEALDLQHQLLIERFDAVDALAAVVRDYAVVRLRAGTGRESARFELQRALVVLATAQAAGRLHHTDGPALELLRKLVALLTRSSTGSPPAPEGPQPAP